MPKGIDCATPLTVTAAQALAAAGMEFACRYLVPERYAWKRLTRQEAEAITAAGMKIVSVFETTANRPAGGTAAGQTDGVLALKEAQSIGQPEGTAIYFAVDYDAQPRDYDAIEQYLRTAAAELLGYAVGVYGSYAVVEEMSRRGAAKHFWQTYAWSRGKKSERANIWQYKNGAQVAGIAVDLNESYGNEGWWDTNPAKTHETVIELWIGKSKARLNGKEIVLDQPPELHQKTGRTMVPVRFVAEALDATVDWDGAQEKITIRR